MATLVLGVTHLQPEHVLWASTTAARGTREWIVTASLLVRSLLPLGPMDVPRWWKYFSYVVYIWSAHPFFPKSKTLVPRAEHNPLWLSEDPPPDLWPPFPRPRPRPRPPRPPLPTHCRWVEVSSWNADVTSRSSCLQDNVWLIKRFWWYRTMTRSLKLKNSSSWTWKRFSCFCFLYTCSPQVSVLFGYYRIMLNTRQTLWCSLRCRNNRLSNRLFCNSESREPMAGSSRFSDL